ncbi:MAG: T9SS type A sorting domain-containing protein, partial [Ignavibacteriaceae bacterium]|nr:T9SS type A sorting domain-containing protein [Ignavibacteriaceae bacterium]
IHHNKIYNNNINPDVMTTGSGINFNGSNANIPIVADNEIYGNHWGITIVGSATQPVPNIGNVENVSTLDDGKNIIHDNVQGADVYDLYNNTGNLIYAQNNDWRVYDSLSIENHIVHQADSSIYGLVKFMPFSQFTPVELISFEARANGSTVSLLWQTSTETNNKGFAIERSYSNKTNWQQISFVNGKGTSTEKQYYRFDDKKVNAGTTLYRLKQLDFDGHFKYFDAIEVSIDAPNQFEISQNYPNPFNPITTIRYELAVNSNVKLTLFNVLGEQIKLLFNSGKPAGTHEYKLDAGELNSGVYFYRIEVRGADGTSFTKTKKLVLAK